MSFHRNLYLTSTKESLLKAKYRSAKQYFIESEGSLPCLQTPACDTSLYFSIITCYTATVVNTSICTPAATYCLHNKVSRRDKKIFHIFIKFIMSFAQTIYHIFQVRFMIYFYTKYQSPTSDCSSLIVITVKQIRFATQDYSK